MEDTGDKARVSDASGNDASRRPRAPHNALDDAYIIEEVRDDTANSGSTGASSGSTHRRSARANVRNAHFLRRRRDSHLITDAQVGPGQDLRRREVEYAILQGIRLPSLALGCIFLALHWWVAAAIVVGITVPLPWIAVVLGNSKGQVRDERERMTYLPGIARQQHQAAESLRAEALASQQRAELGYDPATVIDHEDIDPRPTHQPTSEE